MQQPNPRRKAGSAPPPSGSHGCHRVRSPAVKSRVEFFPLDPGCCHLSKSWEVIHRPRLRKPPRLSIMAKYLSIEKRHSHIRHREINNWLCSTREGSKHHGDTEVSGEGPKSARKPAKEVEEARGRKGPWGGVSIGSCVPQDPMDIPPWALGSARKKPHSHTAHSRHDPSHGLGWVGCRVRISPVRI